MVPFNVAVQRQLEGMQRSGARLVQGYNAQTVHPGVKAAANQAGYLSGIQRNVSKWAANVASKHTLDDLKARMASKGASAYQASATTANAAYSKNTSQWYQTIQNIKANIDSTMPRGTPAQNTARMDEFNRQMNAAAAQMLGAH